MINMDRKIYNASFQRNKMIKKKIKINKKKKKILQIVRVLKKLELMGYMRMNKMDFLIMKFQERVQIKMNHPIIFM